MIVAAWGLLVAHILGIAKNVDSRRADAGIDAAVSIITCLFIVLYLMEC